MIRFAERPRRIAVFRALQLGDMLCAVPALRALRKAEPDATITLIGLPWAASFVERFSHLVDDLMVFPGAPGMPEQPIRAEETEAFYRQARERQFDLAIQLHGSGLVTNAIVRQLGARQMAGFRPVPAAPTAGRSERKWMPGALSYGARPLNELLIDWPGGNEIERLLALTSRLGYAPDGTQLEFPLRPADNAAWQRLALMYDLMPGNFICIHPGARMHSRRWPVERFAAVAEQLRQHWKIVVTGTPDEADLAAQLCGALGSPVINLCGKTDLGAMAAVVKHARLLLCNDTGASHIAAAMRTPSVVVSCGSDSARWAPLDTTRHRVLADYPACRPCMHQDCPVGHLCAEGVEVDDVVAAAKAMIGQSRETQEVSHA